MEENLMTDKEKNLEKFKKVNELNKKEYLKFKTTTYTKQSGNKKKTIEVRTYPNGVVKERIIKQEKIK